MKPINREINNPITTRKFMVRTSEQRYCAACGEPLNPNAPPNAKYCTGYDCKRERWRKASRETYGREKVANDDQLEPQNGPLKCVLCDQPYRLCECVCSWCGAKKWQWLGKYYRHHVCAGKREKAC